MRRPELGLRKKKKVFFYFFFFLETIEVPNKPRNRSTRATQRGRKPNLLGPTVAHRPPETTVWRCISLSQAVAPLLYFILSFQLPAMKTPSEPGSFHVHAADLGFFPVTVTFFFFFSLYTFENDLNTSLNGKSPQEVLLFYCCAPTPYINAQ